MTSYSAISTPEIAVNKPLTSSLITRLRDNPIAMMEKIGFLGPTSGTFTTSEITIAAGAVAAQNHGLAAIPTDVQIFFRCKTAEYGYSVGDELYEGGFGLHVQNSPTGVQVAVSATQVKPVFGSYGPTMNGLNLTNGAGVNFTLANWRLLVRVKV